MKIIVSEKLNTIISFMIFLIPLSIILLTLGYLTDSWWYFLPAVALLNGIFGIVMMFELGIIEWQVKPALQNNQRGRIENNE